MLTRILTITKKKGQGIVEYAVLLAFVVGLAMFLNGAGLKDSVFTVFDNVVYIFGGGDYGHMALDQFNDGNKARRLAADQKALVNLANFFIGKTKKDVKNLLKGDTDHSEGYSGDMAWGNGTGDGEFALGYFIKNDDGGTTFVPFALNHDKAQDILNWMQGDYDQNGNSTDPTNKYLVSDYVMSNGWTGDYVDKQNKLTIRLQYDNNSNNDKKEVVAAKISIDPGNQGTGAGSSGLEVQVKDGKVTYNDTGLSNSAEGWNQYAPKQ